MYHGDDRFDPTSEESDDYDDDSVLHDRNPLSDDGSNPSDVTEDNEDNVEVPSAAPQHKCVIHPPFGHMTWMECYEALAVRVPWGRSLYVQAFAVLVAWAGFNLPWIAFAVSVAWAWFYGNCVTDDVTLLLRIIRT